MSTARTEIRALIVDDEPAARDAIRSLLTGDRDIHVVGECADGHSALRAIASMAPELLFLDVQMPEMDGFTMLRQLDPARLPVVIFVTAFDQYALRAFDVHATDYLLKPFDDDRFREAVSRAKQSVRAGQLGRLSEALRALLDGVTSPGTGTPPRAPAPGGPYLKRLVIKSGGRVTLLNVRDIDWIEAEGDYVKIHVGKAWHLLRETMKRLESQFDPARFVRIHRSTIVNVERIKELQPYFRGEYVVILQDGKSLKLSRGYKEHLESVLGRRF
ncbi:MAG TPA: LytTR family DNA-binding domain-containing protein [Gemmatimonadales bacterium]|nr:LytTR family DNA-binding domain-containing protein [Gemmatimonadales bacterium]